MAVKSSIDVDTLTNTIKFFTSYNPDFVNFAKYHKMKWNPDEKCWYKTFSSRIEIQNYFSDVQKALYMFFDAITIANAKNVIFAKKSKIDAPILKIEKMHLLIMQHAQFDNFTYNKMKKQGCLVDISESKIVFDFFKDYEILKEFVFNNFDTLKKYFSDKINKLREHIENNLPVNEPTIDIPSPEYKKYKNYQKLFVEFAKDKDICILADEMGLGKTIQIIGLINLQNPKTIIVCPAFLKLNWKAELQSWYIHEKEIIVVDVKNLNKIDFSQNAIYIINYEILPKIYPKIKNITFDLAVFDEAHYMKSIDTLRTIYGLMIPSLKKVFATGTPILNRITEFVPLIFSSIYQKALTEFYIMNDDEIKTLATILFNKGFGIKQYFVNEQYPHIQKLVNSFGAIRSAFDIIYKNNKIDKKIKENMEYEEHLEIFEKTDIETLRFCIISYLLKRYFIIFSKEYCDDYGMLKADKVIQLKAQLKHYMIRRTKDEVLKELPNKIRNIIFCGHLDSKLMEIENELYEKFILKHSFNNQKTNELLPKHNAHVEYKSYLLEYESLINQIKKKDKQELNIGDFQVIKHFVGLKKVPKVIEFAEDIIEQGENRLIIVAVHSDVIHSIANILKQKYTNVHIITGDVKVEERHKIVQDFQSEDDDIKIIVGNIKAMGVGITLTKSKNMIFAELSYVPAEMIQAEDRIYRIGQYDNVNINYIVFEKSIDEKIYNLIEEKNKEIQKILKVSDVEEKEMSEKELQTL